MKFSELMQHVEIILLVLAISLPFVIGWMLLVRSLLNEPLKKRVYFCGIFVFCLIQVIVNYLSGYQILFDMQTYMGVFIYEVVTFMFQGVVMSFILWRFKVKGLLRIVSVVTVAYSFIFTFMGVGTMLLYFLTPLGVLMGNLEYVDIVNVVSHMTVLILSLVVVWFLNKIQLGYKLEAFFENKKKTLVLFISVFLAKDVYRLLLYAEIIEDEGAYLLIGILILIFIFLFLLYISIIEVNRQKIASQNTSIIQNEVNVKSLEKIQQEFRMLRHDFKNMLSSLYLQISEGDRESVQKFVKDASQRFDYLSEAEPIQKDTLEVDLLSPKASHILSNFKLYIKKVMKEKRSRAIFLMVILVAITLIIVTIRFYPAQGTMLIGIVFGVFMFALLALICLSILHLNQSKLASQTILLESQNAYTLSLQATQKEIAPIIENYKSMLSKLADDAQRGHFKEIETLIMDTTSNVDDYISLEIKKTAQLKNIKIIEVRSLMLTKMLQMSKGNIKYSLEIILPIEHLGMEVQDFNRCLGILLDNAMEASQDMADGYIDILMLEENQSLNIIVKNRTDETQSLRDVYQEGFSTKGNNRGLGLASYKRIISKYKNISTRTQNNDGFFIQELRIQG